MLIALGAAGVTLAVALGVIGIPMVDACSADPRGVITCLRDMADRKFDLPGILPGKSADIAPGPPLVTKAEDEVAASPSPLRGGDRGGGPQPPASQQASVDIVADPPQSHPVPADASTTAVDPELATPSQVETASADTEHPPSGQGGPLVPAEVDPATFAPELAAAPEAPVIPPAAPAPQPSVDTALTWTAPPPTDLGPSPDVPIADETTQQAAATPMDPLPSTAAREPVLEPEAAPEPKPKSAADPLAVVPKSEMAVAPAADPSPVAAAPEPEPAPAADDAVAFDPAPVGTVPPAPAVDVANTEPAKAQAPPPGVAAPLILAPTIDAIELEGSASYVSGSGPAGALMRLYADGELIGESPVEEGRWLVEGRNLLDSPRRELRVEAIEPETGRLLGSAAITVEIELPDGDTPPDERPAKPPEFGSSVAPPDIAEPGPEAFAELPTMAAEPPAAPATSEPEEVTSTTEPAPIAESETQAAAEPQIEPAPIVEPDPIVLPEPLPELAVVAPQRESASVEILGPPKTEPSVLPPIGATEHEPATITLDPPDAPALVADLTVPTPKPDGQPVTILRLLPFGDPDSGRYNVGKAIIRHGDTLWSIARRYYGHGIHYRTIFHANRDLIRRPSRIFPGQVFDLPLVTDD